MKRGSLTVLLVLILIAGCTQEPPKEEAIDLGPPSLPVMTSVPPGPSPTETTPPETAIDKWASTTPATTTSGISRVPPQEAYGILLNHSNDPSFVIIDLRTPEERATSRLPYGSMNLNFDAPDFQERISELSHDNTYLIYCQTGSRTASALDMMAEMGFKTVYELDGGIDAWEDAGFEVDQE